MALGAQKGDVLRMIVRQGMTLTIHRCIRGAPRRARAYETIATLVFGVGTNDPGSFIGIPILVLSVAFLACYLPVRHAAKLDPLTALSPG